MKVEISNIKIKVNKKSVTLTLAESKLLFEKLNEIFGPKYNYTYPIYQQLSPITWSSAGSSIVEFNDGGSTIKTNDDSVYLTKTNLDIDLTNKGN